MLALLAEKFKAIFKTRVEKSDFSFGRTLCHAVLEIVIIACQYHHRVDNLFLFIIIGFQMKCNNIFLSKLLEILYLDRFIWVKKVVLHGNWNLHYIFLKGILFYSGTFLSFNP